MDLSKLKPHFLQTSNWVAVRRAQGEEVVDVHGQALRVKPLPSILKPFGYMEQVDLKQINWEELNEIGQSRGLSHILLDPVNSKEESLSFPDKLKISSTKSVFHRHTAVIDLTQTEEELLANMHKKWRYNIRLAEKKEVEVSIRDTSQAFNTFLKLYTETAKRQSYFGRDKKYLETVWNSLKPLGKAKIAIASFENQPLVAWMLLLGEDGLYYPYGGSNAEYRNLMPTHALVWEIVKWGKAEGFEFFDLWGADPDMPGVRKMKLGFGPEEIIYQQSRVVVIDSMAYKLFQLANIARNLGLNVRRLFK